MMGLGAAMLEAFVMMLLGYVLWVVFVVVSFRPFNWSKRPLLGGIGLLSLIFGPLVFFIVYVGMDIDADAERQRRDRIDLTNARSRWKLICSDSQNLVVIRRAVSSQREILVRDVYEERSPLNFNNTLGLVVSGAIFPESPFSLVIQKIPIQVGHALCEDSKPGFQCRNPTHVYKFWSGQYDTQSVAANWNGVLRYVLTFEEQKATDNQYIGEQNILLSEDDEVIARAKVHYFDFPADGGRPFCPDRVELIKSMISEVFPVQDRSAVREPLEGD